MPHILLYSTVFYFRATNTEIFDFDIFKPFKSSVWLSFVLLILAFSCLLRYIFKYEGGELETVSTFLLAFGAFCQQGINTPISMNSTRCLIVFMFISSVLTYNFYTSVLVSTLVETKRETNIKTKEDLVSNNIPIAFFDSTLIRGFLNVSVSSSFCKESFRTPPFPFQTTTEPDYLDFIQKTVLSSGRSLESFFMSANEGFRRARGGSFAFYCERSVALTAIPRIFEPSEVCDTKEILFRRDDPIGIVMKKFAPLRERLLINWIWMNEIGLVRQTLRYWSVSKLSCQTKGRFLRVEFEYIAAMYTFLAAAYVLSLCCLVAEIQVAKWRKSRPNTLERTVKFSPDVKIIQS